METTRSIHLRNVVNSVPDEIWIKVLGYLSNVDISVVGGTSRRFNLLAKDPSLWKKTQFDIVNLEANLWPVVLLVDRAVKAEEMRFTNERNKKVGDMTVASLIVRAKETLKVLILSSVIELDNEAVEKFGCLTKLEVLDLGFENISSTGVKAIATLKCLKELKIPSRLDDRDSDFGYLFNELKKLEVVHMPKISITSGTFNILIANNSNLEKLSFHCTGSISLGDLAKNCRNLKSLDLAFWGGLSDATINDLVHAKKLEKLDLRGCSQLTNSTLKNISQNCTELKYLRLVDCGGVRDEGIRVLAENCPNLQFLDLKGCHTLTKGVIVELAMLCKKITKLILPKTIDVTFKKKLRKEYPNLIIIRNRALKWPTSTHNGY